MGESEGTDFRSVALTILILLTTAIAVRGSNNMIQTTVPLLAHYNFLYSKFNVGILSALFGLSTFLTTTFINSVLRSKQRRVAFMASTFSYTIILFSFYFSSSASLWLLTSLSGAVLGFMMPNMMTSAGLFRNRQVRERAISLYATSLSISLILGPVFETYILSIFPLKYAFLFFVPFGIVASALAPFIRFPDDSTVRERGSFHPHPGFKTAVYLNLSYAIPFLLITVFAGIYAHTDLNVSYSTVTLLYALFFATSFISRLALSVKRPSDSLWSIVALTMALTMAGLVVMYFSSSEIMFAFSLALLGIPHGLSFPVSLLFISRSYSPENRNAANSYFFSTMMLVSVASTVIGGLAIQSVGFRYTFLLLLPLIALLMCMVYLSGKEYRSTGEMQAETTGR